MVAVVYAPRPTPQLGHVQLHRPMARDEGESDWSELIVTAPPGPSGRTIAGAVVGSIAGGLLLVALVFVVVKFFPKKKKGEDAEKLGGEVSAPAVVERSTEAPGIVVTEKVENDIPPTTKTASIRSVLTPRTPSIHRIQAFTPDSGAASKPVADKASSVRSVRSVDRSTDLAAVPKAQSLRSVRSVQIRNEGLDTATPATVDATVHNNSVVQHAERY